MNDRPSGALGMQQKRLKTFGKEYQTRKKKTVPAKEKPNLNVSKTIY